MPPTVRLSRIPSTTASHDTTKVLMPSFRAVLMNRQAISPRLAISIFWNMNGYHPGDSKGGTPSRGPMIGAKGGRTIGDVEPQPRQRPHHATGKMPRL